MKKISPAMGQVLMWGMGALLYLVANHFWPNLIFRILGYLCALMTVMYLFRWIKWRAAKKETEKKNASKFPPVTKKK